MSISLLGSLPPPCLPLTATSGGRYTNDADGNTLTGGGRTNAWDSSNRLVSSVVGGTTSAFTYGCDGLRRSGTVTPSGGGATTTRYAYDGTTMVPELRVIYGLNRLG